MKQNPGLKKNKGDIVATLMKVLHIPGLSLTDWLDIRRLHFRKNAIGISFSVEKNIGASFFGNNANQAVYWEHPG